MILISVCKKMLLIGIRFFSSSYFDTDLIEITIHFHMKSRKLIINAHDNRIPRLGNILLKLCNKSNII